MKKIILILLAAILIPSMSYSQSVDLNKTVKIDKILVNDLNVSIDIPAGWGVMPVNDHHFAAVLLSDPQPKLKTTLFQLMISPLKAWPSLEIMQKDNAQRKAAQLEQAQLISLGSPERIQILGREATAYMYSFTYRGVGFLYELVTFEINGVAFMATYWGVREGGHFDLFRKWAETGIKKIDEAQDVPKAGVLQKLETVDAAAIKLVAEEKATVN